MERDTLVRLQRFLSSVTLDDLTVAEDGTIAIRGLEMDAALKDLGRLLPQDPKTNISRCSTGANSRCMARDI